MQYRKFGQLNWDVSILGFGAMRFPTHEGKIDEPEATKMLYRAIDQGVNYVDTGYPYHDGQSEVFLGKTLQGRYREKAKIATKLPSWAVNDAEDFDKYFSERDKRLAELKSGFVGINICVSVKNETVYSRYLTLTIEDSGPGFDIMKWNEKDKDKDSAALSGRGLLLIKQLCESVTFNESGNKVEVVMAGI